MPVYLFKLNCKVCYAPAIIRVPNLDNPVIKVKCASCGVLSTYDLRRYPYTLV